LLSKPSEFDECAAAIVAKYLDPERVSKVEVDDKLKQMLYQMVSGNSQGSRKVILKHLLDAQEAVLQIMALSAFPRFLKSSTFIEWRDTEVELSADEIEYLTCIKDPESKQGSVKVLHRRNSDVMAEASVRRVSALPKKDEESKDEKAPATPAAVRRSSLQCIQLLNCTPSRRAYAVELEKALNSNDWLGELLCAIESLPVCVTLATASRHLRGFPLIFVNHKFEETTGYSREEIIGKNCRFLQNSNGNPPDATDATALKKISRGLANASVIKVCLTNYRKDGTPFRNMLALKPIFDDNDEYAYVLGIQYDVDGKDAFDDKLKLVEMLFDTLPSRIGKGNVPGKSASNIQKMIDEASHMARSSSRNVSTHGHSNSSMNVSTHGPFTTASTSTEFIPGAVRAGGIIIGGRGSPQTTGLT
jgi:PAS domain S-box-containing protein